MPIDPSSTGSITQHDAALLSAAASVQGSSNYAPQMSGLVCSGAAPWLFLSSTTPTSNQGRGTRVVIPKTGILHDFSILLNGRGAGNIDVGIYDYVAEPRSRLWHTGSVSIPAATGWQIVGDPNLAVTQGQVLDFVYVTDTGTSLDVGGIFEKDIFAGALPSAAFWPVPNGSTYISYHVASVFPLPTTIADANLARDTFVPCLMARIV